MRLLKLSVPLSLLLLAPPLGVSRAEAAVTATVAGNQLVVAGDDAANQITLRLFLLDDREIQVLDGSAVIARFTRATFASIVVNANGGNDTVVLSRIFGAITESATINGGPGDDQLSGGASGDSLIGGSGNDVLTWNPGDGNDSLDGGADVDRVVVNGSAAAEVFMVAEHPLSPGRVQLTRDLDAVTLAIGTTERLEVNALGGPDTINAFNLPAGLITMTADGGDGDDELLGGIGEDILMGGDGNDRLRGGQGDDDIFAGAGDDEILCCVNEDNDVINGQTGFDRLTFNGQGTAEDVTITPEPGGSVRFAIAGRDIVMLLQRVEQIAAFTFEGNDRVTGTDGLAANGLVSIIADGGVGNDTLVGGDTNDELEGGPGSDTLIGGAGDDTLHAGPGATDVLEGRAGNDLMIWSRVHGNVTFLGGDGIDRFVVNGSSESDTFKVYGNANFSFVDRVAPTLTNLGGQAEVIEINTLGGDDIVTVEGGMAALSTIEIDAGPGADRIDTVASSVIVVNGNDEEDSLFFDALTQPIAVTPATISAGGVTRVTRTQVERLFFLNLLSPLPAISITSPASDPATASTPFITLAGTAAGASGIASIGVTSDRGGSVVAAGTAQWTAANVPLAAGANVLTATVKDTAGNEVSDTITVAVNAFTYTLAEGSTGAFFDTDILIANPNTVEAPVSLTFLKGDGSARFRGLTLGPTSRTTIRVDEIPGFESTEVSVTVTSTAALPIVVERTMRWDATGYGAHTEKATEGPATNWFFAEGAQGFFDTYVLLANPGAIENIATVTFLLENGAPVVKTFPVPPNSRFTVPANTIPEVINRSFGIAVSFTQPGVAERAMYFGARLFDAGHESAGVNAPSTSWFLAEGATGSFFTTFVLLANPGTADATATVTFLPESGAAVKKAKVVPAGQRVTLNIATEDASLASGAIATAVQSTQPILVERAQYWPFTPDRWHEAHNSFGSTAVGTKWGLAEGRAGGPEGYQTYILLANADATQAAQVRITFLRSNGTTVTQTFTVNPTSRLNVQAHSVPELAGESFGALIEVTSGPGIFVERALYSDAQGVTFAAGTNALATRLP